MKQASPFIPGTTLMRADETRIGDVVVFRASFATYTVEDIDTTSTGMVRHSHGDGAASNSYHPEEMLYIRRPK